MSLLVITGPGRCGTSLLAFICHELGYDPGGGWHPRKAINAGWESRQVVEINTHLRNGNGRCGEKITEAIRRINRRVIKDPRFVRWGGKVRNPWLRVRRDLRFLLLTRDYQAAAKSLKSNPLQWPEHKKQSIDELSALLERQVQQFREDLREHGVGWMELQFPYFLIRPRRVFNTLMRFGQLDVSRVAFDDAWQRIVDRSKVHF